MNLGPHAYQVRPNEPDPTQRAPEKRRWGGDGSPGRRPPAAKTPLQDWYAQVSAADWATPSELKAQFADASILRGGRVAFNVAGNKYRLIVRINYAFRVVYVRFVGTHEEYDAVDATTI